MGKKPIGKVSRKIKDKCVEALISLQAFETFWAYWFQSSGNVYAEQLKEATKLLLRKLDELNQIYPRALDIEEHGEGAREYYRGLLDELDEWSDTVSYSYINNKELVHTSISSFAMCLKVFLLRVIGLDCWPPIIISYEPQRFTLDMQQWKPHIPYREAYFRYNNVNELNNELNANNSIVIVADIRRSQDLMTYAISPENFSERLNTFLQTARDLLIKNCGIFDKFTGDGFIAYFSPATTEKDHDYIKCFTSFCKDFFQFCKPHFESWNESVQKLPHSLPGVAIGADLGKITFDVKGGHLVAVGSSIVWASRLASIANSGEVAINNCLWTSLKNEKLVVTNREGTTKAGEDFLARVWCPK